VTAAGADGCTLMICGPPKLPLAQKNASTSNTTTTTTRPMIRPLLERASSMPSSTRISRDMTLTLPTVADDPRASVETMKMKGPPCLSSAT